MLTIRLQRLGKKKQPTYRLIVSEKPRSQAGSLEILGHYNPTVEP
jgi:small subunit ribosomal protein S16